MKHASRPVILSLIVAVLSAAPAAAQTTAPLSFETMEALQNAANGKAGPRTVPGRSIPVPDTASPALQASIAGPYRVPNWNANPKSAAEWKALIASLADAGAAARQATREKLGVTMEPTVIGGVKAFGDPAQIEVRRSRPSSRRPCHGRDWRTAELCPPLDATPCPINHSPARPAKTAGVREAAWPSLTPLRNAPGWRRRRAP